MLLNSKFILFSQLFFSVNTFSNKVEFLWPPGCHHLMLPSWQVETCSISNPDTCKRDSIRGHQNGGYTVENLEPCRGYLVGGNQVKYWISIFQVMGLSLRPLASALSSLTL